MKNNHFTEMRAIIHGKVQGVGFRAKVQAYALQLNLKGTVCNLSDNLDKINLSLIISSQKIYRM